MHLLHKISKSSVVSGITTTTKNSTTRMGRSDKKKKKLPPYYHPVYHGSASSNATLFITPKYSPRKSSNNRKQTVEATSKPISQYNGMLVEEAVDRVQI